MRETRTSGSVGGGRAGTMGVGLRPTAKAVDVPPNPTVPYPAPYPTSVAPMGCRRSATAIPRSLASLLGPCRHRDPQAAAFNRATPDPALPTGDRSSERSRESIVSSLSDPDRAPPRCPGSRGGRTGTGSRNHAIGPRGRQSRLLGGSPCRRYGFAPKRRGHSHAQKDE